MHQGLQLTIPELWICLVTRFLEIPHKGGYGIVNYNHRRTCFPLVPKRDTFYVTDGSPQVKIMLHVQNII